MKVALLEALDIVQRQPKKIGIHFSMATALLLLQDFRG